jgi:phospholipase A-2-activating protein
MLTCLSTASADLFVRLWHGEELKRVFAGHTDVVRAISLLPPQSSSVDKSLVKVDLPTFYDQEALFATASNDDSLRVWSLDDRRCPKGNPGSGGDSLRILQSTESNDILYDVKYAGILQDSNARVVISCGEDGLLRGWNIEDGTLIMSIPQPVTSVWSLAVMPLSGDFVTANSDGLVRVYTQRAASVTQGQAEGSISQVTEEQLKEHEEKCRLVASKGAAR